MPERLAPLLLTTDVDLLGLRRPGADVHGGGLVAVPRVEVPVGVERQCLSSSLETAASPPATRSHCTWKLALPSA